MMGEWTTLQIKVCQLMHALMQYCAIILLILCVALKGFAVQSSYRLNLPPHLIVHASNIKMTETIGQGSYKPVVFVQVSIISCHDTFRGIWCGLQRTPFGRWRENSYGNCGNKNSKRYMYVCISSINFCFGDSQLLIFCMYWPAGFYDSATVRDMLKECSKMSKFDHPNVLTLNGVCLDGGPAPFIIMPFMINGSLLAYLRKNRAILVISGDTDSQDDNEVRDHLVVWLKNEY